MRISVIVPFWKHKIFLKDCLNSLSLSTFQDYETILVLDHNEEDVYDLIDEYKDAIHLRVIQSEKHGVAAARNKGIEEAKGEYIYFLDSDDYILEDTLGRIAAAIATKPGCDICSGTRLSTWHKRINFLDIDHTKAIERVENKYDNWMTKKLKMAFPDYNPDEDQKMATISLLTLPRGFYNITALKNAYRRDYLLTHDIKFNEDKTYYVDQPFVVEVLNYQPTIVVDQKAYYIKRKHNDPYNYPALNREEDEKRPFEQMQAYGECIDKAKVDLTKRALEYQMCKYIASTFINRLRRSNDEIWKNVYYPELQPYVAQMDPESYHIMSSYQKKCIELMKADDMNGMIKHVGRKFAKKRIKRIFKKRSLNEIYKALYTHRYMKMPVKKNVILFESFFGKSYSDSPKYLYEYVAKNYPGKFEIVWALNNDTELPYGGKKIRRFSKEYAYYMATAKYIIINVRQPLWFKKREGQVLVETWHGTPLKRLVFDQEDVMSASPKYKMQFYKQRAQWDYLVSANQFSTDTFRSCFMYEGEMLDEGYPRNDILYDENKDQIAHDLREKLGIPQDKKTILYAPTWRDDESYGSGQYKFTLALDLHRLQQEFGDEYVVLLRTHYYIADKIDVTGMEDFVYNLSDYNDIAEIYLISDICITDYSSVFFDYANLRRPILFYTYDLERYRDQLRGFYISIEDDVPGPLLLTNDDVVDAIHNIDQVTEDYKEKYDIFYNRFCSFDDGHASERIIKRVFKEHE
jgi:CDP-glycerol glycerophosphotransferase